MNTYEDLVWRDLIKDVSDSKKLKNWFDTKDSGIYIGFDPSFKSLHLGNYQTLCILKRLAQGGHKTYAIAGGITGIIGDPKPSMERQMQSIATINENVKAISLQLKKYSGVEKIINNMDFYKEMSIVEYLRDIGKMINVNYILEKEIVARRLSVGISYAEFSYTILQGYDYLQLFEKYNITCQSGGSDQWGNITTGLEFIRKSHGDTPACCFSCNLLLKPDGTKFGKSEGGAMYLDPEITSPYKLFQFLINQEDAMILTLLKRLTFLTKEEIENIMKEHQAAPFKRIGQKALAKAIVTDIHGKAAYDTAADISDKLFRGELKELQPNDLFDALNGTNVFEATAAQYNIVDLLVSAKVCDSKTTGRKLIEQKSVYLNDKLVSDFSFEVKKSEAYSKVPNFSFIKKGKRDYFLIKWN